MRIVNTLTDAAVLAEFGRRLARRRLAHNLTQVELAREAGVDRTALQRLERGESVTMTTAMRVLRALGLLENLEAALPPDEPTPIELLKARGRPRQRARSRTPKPPSGGGWRWGDEQ